jgi:DegV family protein with EDD domain
MEIGFDGIKFLYKPDVQKLERLPLDHAAYEPLFAQMEKDCTHITWHVADPDNFWDAKTGRKWDYSDGTYPLYEDMMEQTYNVLENHPQLTATFAHFMFLSQQPELLEELFAKYSKEYDGVIHISLGSGFSSSYQNACIAAEDFPNVRVIDSMNLSTGQGHVVLEACRLRETCEDLDEVAEKLRAFAPRVEASFLLDQLTYMVKGGRCSAVAALGANLLGLKPCIEVKDGKMGVVKKYRGKYEKCLTAYVKDRLADREDIVRDELFLTYTPVSTGCLAAVKDAIEAYGNFNTVYETTAGCTVSCHCGPGTLGVLFVRK